MEAVIDANELFSLLIRGSHSSETIFFSDRIVLIAPEFLLEEFKKNREEILKKTHKTDMDFVRLLSIYKRRITFVPKEEFVDCLDEAVSLLPDHPKDEPYLALALKRNAFIWSEDKALKRQSRVLIRTTKEFADFLG